MGLMVKLCKQSVASEFVLSTHLYLSVLSFFPRVYEFSQQEADKLSGSSILQDM